MKIIVTGASGFLGSNFTEYLINMGHKVYAFDNESTGSIENLKPFILAKKIKYKKWDITDPKTVKIFRKIGADRIYNFACPASPKYYQKFPVETWESSVLGVRNILLSIKGTKTRLLQTSTSEVYGDPSVNPQPETYFGNVNPNGVRSCYDEGKRAAEAIIFDFLRTNPDIQVRVARIFNTYGPKMAPEDGRVVSNFIMQALKNKDITIYGDGSITRSFCFVDDMMRGLYTLMECDKKEAQCSPINLGNPDERTIKSAAEIILKLTNSKSKMVICDKAQDDPERRRPDISKAQKVLGWKPEILFEQGITKTIEYYKQQI